MNEIGKDTDEIGGSGIWAVKPRWEFTSSKLCQDVPFFIPSKGRENPPLGPLWDLFCVELMVTKRQLGFGDREAAGCAGDAICGGVERARLPSIG